MKINILLITLALVLFFIYRFPYLSDKSIKLENKADSLKLDKIELPFTDKFYAYDYNSIDSKLVENISIFDPSETWTGSGFYDVRFFFEYPASLVLAGADKNKIVIWKNLNLDLGKIESFELIINLRTSPNELENSDLIFFDDNLKTARYAISIVRNGWDILKFTKKQFELDKQFNWNNISQVKFELTPRPLGKVVVNLAGFRAYGDVDLSNDWNYVDKRMMILDKRQNKISLLARNAGAVPVGVTIRKITTASNFSFQSAFSPMSETWTGLFFRGNHLNSYGYYLMVNGIGGSQWQVYKVYKEGLKVLKRDIISDFQFKFGKWYWLKVEAKEDILNVYLSSDGVQFNLLGTVIDNEFTSGGVGIAIGNGAISLYNDFAFEQ